MPSLIKNKLSIIAKKHFIKYPHNFFSKNIFNFKVASRYKKRTMMIALTYQCQCHCIHCGSGLYKLDKNRELTSSEIIELIDSAKKLKVTAVYFFGGEPLLLPELSNYIRHAKINGFLVKLDTNGLLLDETKVKELKKSGIDRIGVSIDSPYETVHDKLRGVNGIFNKAMEGIKYCRKYGIYCYISVYATKENLKNGELLRVINLAKSLGAKTRILSTICSGKWIDRNDLTLSTEDISLLKSFLENKIVYWEIEDLDEKVNSFFCVALKKELFYVSAYGDVQPCCYLPVSFGNIREEPLEKIVKRMWSSDLILDHKIYYDCPANNLDIAKRYSNLIRPKGQYPIRFEHCLSANNLNKQE